MDVRLVTQSTAALAVLALLAAPGSSHALDKGEVQAALDEVMQDRTTFVIAHRLSTIRNATRIIVFREGRVVETGSFDQLVARDGAFAELARSQFLVGEKKAEEKAEDAAE